MTHDQYCMVYGMHKEGRLRVVYCARVKSRVNPKIVRVSEMLEIARG